MIIDCFGTDFQPVVFVVISNPETSSPVTQSIGFQPKPLLSIRRARLRLGTGFQLAAINNHQ